jgi:3-hydroxyacyl-CoA dehydrogenase
MGTLSNIFSYWGAQLDDQEMLANAAYIQEHLIEEGRTGLQAGRGYYEYPNPAYQQAGFLNVPSMSEVPALAAKAKLS